MFIDTHTFIHIRTQTHAYKQICMCTHCKSLLHFICWCCCHRNTITATVFFLISHISATCADSELVLTGLITVPHEQYNKQINNKVNNLCSWNRKASPPASIVCKPELITLVYSCVYSGVHSWSNCMFCWIYKWKAVNTISSGYKITHDIFLLILMHN